MIDLVITHLNHPWGPPGTLETLGDHWRPLATMPENGQNELWAPYTIWQAVLKGQVILRQNAYFGPD